MDYRNLLYVSMVCVAISVFAPASFLMDVMLSIAVLCVILYFVLQRRERIILYYRNKRKEPRKLSYAEKLEEKNEQEAVSAKETMKVKKKSSKKDRDMFMDESDDIFL